MEEIPTEDLHLSEEEMLVPVAHFHKEIFSTFGIPFLLKIKQGELVSQIMDKIQKKLDIQEKEFEKVRLALIL